MNLKKIWHQHDYFIVIVCLAIAGCVATNNNLINTNNTQPIPQFQPAVPSSGILIDNHFTDWNTNLMLCHNEGVKDCEQAISRGANIKELSNFLVDVAANNSLKSYEINSNFAVLVNHVKLLQNLQDNRFLKAYLDGAREEVSLNWVEDNRFISVPQVDF